MKKVSVLKMELIKIVCSLVNGELRTRILKSQNIFAEFGDDNKYLSKKIPTEPYLVKIHNNVLITAGVTLLTHDVINDMFSIKLNKKPGEVFSEYQMGTIEIYDNVMIGANSIILPNVKIGPDAIIAAGSIVTRDVAPNTIVGGNPAKKIGDFDKLLAERRQLKNTPIDRDPIEDIMKYYWG